MYSGGLKNDWVVGESEAFQKDWSEADMLASAKAGGIDIKSYVFLECFNRSPADEAKWVQSMVDDPESKCVGFSAIRNLVAIRADTHVGTARQKRFTQRARHEAAP